MRFIKIVLIILLCVGLIFVGLLLYTHFVTNSIADIGGMENPDYVDTPAHAQSAHYRERMVERRITDDEVRSYSDNAKAMLVQWGGESRRYISDEGMCVIEKQQDDWVYKTV